MRILQSRQIYFVLLFVLLLVPLGGPIPPAAAAQPNKTLRTKVFPPGVTPEKVRLSYVEGDVRFNRGGGKKPSLKKPWEQARVGLSVEQNYTLSTGINGRVEIEFQTAGVLYLAANSVLEFNQLSVNDDVPTTRLRLISGTVTTDIEPIRGEVFVIAMSPGSYTVKYPEFDYTRVESYMGGMSFTPQVNAGSRFEQTHSAGDQAVKLGETLVYSKGGESEVEGTGKDKGPAGWDNWVAARCAERQEFTEASLRAPKLIPPSLDIAGLYSGPRLSQCEAHAVCCDRSVWSKPFEDAALQEAADRQAASKDAQRANTVSVKELQDESARQQDKSTH